METIDLVATATQILELLSDQGISDKSLHAYTHTGIGCVIRHFQAKGILCAAPEMLDAFLLEQREFFDQGAFSVWKWRLLRRGCELLKHCAEKGSVDLPPLSPWMPALRRPRQSIWKDTPTPEQLANWQRPISKLAQGCVLDTGDAPDRSYYFGEGSKLGATGTC